MPECEKLLGALVEEGLEAGVAGWVAWIKVEDVLGAAAFPFLPARRRRETWVLRFVFPWLFLSCLSSS